MRKLWAFGCSHTYGHGLPDCHIPPHWPGLAPSQLAWPAVLAQRLNLPCENHSDPGAGVRWVWHQAVHADVQPDDLVIVFWPDWLGRTDVLLGPDLPRGDHIKLRSYQPADADYFARYWSSYDQWVTFCALADQLHTHFARAQVHYHQLVWDQMLYTDWPWPSWSHTSWLPVYFGAEPYRALPLALDQGHNGEQAHQLFAEHIHTQLTRAGFQ
jgi:hypothetical protein